MQNQPLAIPLRQLHLGAEKIPLLLQPAGITGNQYAVQADFAHGQYGGVFTQLLFQPVEVGRLMLMQKIWVQALRVAPGLTGTEGRQLFALPAAGAGDDQPGHPQWLRLLPQPFALTGKHRRAKVATAVDPHNSSLNPASAAAAPIAARPGTCGPWRQPA